MITLAQRITELRTQKGMSRPELSLALGLPKTAVEKFETGRQTPTQEQQKKMAAYFGVSLFYLRGESNDPTTQDSWMNGAIPDDDQYTLAVSLLATTSTENVCHITLMDLRDASDFFALHSGDYALGSIYGCADHIR